MVLEIMQTKQAPGESRKSSKYDNTFPKKNDIIGSRRSISSRRF